MTKSIFACALFLAVFGLNAYADIGTDPTFGTSGKTLIQFSGETFDVIQEQSDGNLLLGGFIPGKSEEECNLAVRRLTENGALDPGYGESGLWSRRYARNTCAKIQVMRVQPDGKLLVGGVSREKKSNTAFLFRLDNQGKLDTSFGSKGFVELVTSKYKRSVTTILPLENGEILVGGETLFGRVTAKGKYVDQIQQLAGADADLLAFLHFQRLPDQSFLISGELSHPLMAPRDVFTAKFTPDLRVDERYGVSSDGKVGGGYSTFNLGYCFPDLASPVLLDDGSSILPVGCVGQSPMKSFLFKVDSNGRPDERFGFEGRAEIDRIFDAGPNFYSFVVPRFVSLLRQSDDRVVVAGITWRDHERRSSLLRLTSEGRIDRTFGVGGMSVATFDGNFSLRSADFGQAFVLKSGRILHFVPGTVGKESAAVLIRYLP